MRLLDSGRLISGKEHLMADRRAADGLFDAPTAGNGEKRYPGHDIAKAHADFVMALAARKPCPIALDPHPEDFTARALLCEALIEAVQPHVTALIEDAAQNDPGSHIRDAALAASIYAHLTDRESDITGRLQQVAER